MIFFNSMTALRPFWIICNTAGNERSTIFSAMLHRAQIIILIMGQLICTANKCSDTTATFLWMHGHSYISLKLTILFFLVACNNGGPVPSQHSTCAFLLNYYRKKKKWCTSTILTLRKYIYLLKILLRPLGYSKP